MNASIEHLIRDGQTEGEPVVTFARAKYRVGKQDFTDAAVVLTERRLFLATTDWPTDYEISISLERDSCFLLNHEELADGSTLLLICHPCGVLCLYLAPSWNEEAQLVRETLSAGPILPKDLMLSPRSVSVLRQGLEGFWRHRLGCASSADRAERVRSFLQAREAPRPVDFALQDDVFAEFHGLTVEEDDGEED